MSLLGGESSNPATGEPATAPMTLAQAAERIRTKTEAPEPRERPTEAAVEDDQADQGQTDGGEPDEGEAPADGDAEAEEATDSGEDEDEQRETPPLDLTQKVKVKIDGEEREVALSEALAGYQRLSNYTRGKQELAREREAFAEEQRSVTAARDAVVAERQHLATLTNAIRTQLLGPLPTQAQLDQLRATNPGQWAATMEDLRQRVARVQAIEGEAAGALHRTTQEAQAARAKAAEQGMRALAADIPEFGDPAKVKVVQAEMRTALQGAGYSDAEIAQIVDPRIVKFVHRAMKDAKDAEAYRKLQARGARTEQRVAEAPQVARPGAAVSRTAVAETRVKDLRNRAAKSGRVDDIAALIAAKTARN